VLSLAVTPDGTDPSSKLFVRNDLFRKILRGGFVNLTHINAKRVQITWHAEDLYALLCRRIRECPEFLNYLAFTENTSDEEFFSTIFPLRLMLGKSNRQPGTGYCHEFGTATELLLLET
jgi:hypothetical protein